MEKKRILCFGDSNTWGFDPVTGNRYPETVRWTRVLSSLLGDEYEIIEEGQNGRTIAMDDPAEGGQKNGLSYLIPCLESQFPLYGIIIMLGTNDLKARFGFDGMSIAGEMQYMLQEMYGFLTYNTDHFPHVLLVSPPQIRDDIDSSKYASMMGFKRSVEVSKELSSFYKQLAMQFQCDFLDAATLVKTSPVDALHLTEEGHHTLAVAFADYFKQIIA